MANKNLFSSLVGAFFPRTDTVNAEGAPAYARTPKQALAQYAATGCLNATFYASAEEQRDNVLEACSKVEPDFIARTAVFARERGFMKDLPAFLAAVLSARDGGLLEKVFPRVIDSGRMLRTFVQILRSGAVGRKSLGSRPKRLVRRWLEGRSDEEVFRASVGNDPSIADIVKMVHPAPKTPEREALYGYLLGRTHDVQSRPEAVVRFERWKKGETGDIPDVPFQMLTAMELGTREWTSIARNASWQATRMNLRTFARHGVFRADSVVREVAARLRDPEEIGRARAFPYQLMAAFRMSDATVPRAIREALEDAMEIAIRNVPALDGKVFVCPDVSGSMSSPVTGSRKGASTAVRCVDVAALVAASVVRRNPAAEVLPFEEKVVEVSLSTRDSVMTNAAKLAAVGGGGTSCSAPLALLNARQEKGDLVLLVSDNQSWADAGGHGTPLMREWGRFKARNPGARMVCLDLQPGATAQAVDRADILNVGGFSDAVFEVVAEFAKGRLADGHWVRVIEEIKL